MNKLRSPFLLFYLFFAVLGPASGQGFLKASGKIIVNEKGENVLLRGIGLGGWMLQEGYMLRLQKEGQQYRIKQRIEKLIGESQTKEFYTAWLNNHTTRSDIDSLHAWGFNSVRLPMHYDLFTLSTENEPVKGQNTWLPTGFALTDSLVAWCRSNHMYVILDLHAAPGGQGNDLNISDRDPSKPSLWQNEADKQKTIALWRKLAERYANEPVVGGYDLLNEPNWGFEDTVKDRNGLQEQKNVPLKKLLMDITAAIREVDTRHIIIIEGNGWGNNYHGMLGSWDNNMVLSFHKYGNFNDEAAIKKYLDLREKYNVPIWLGESGENSNTWFTEAIRLAESNGIGWAWWQEKKMGINNPVEIKIPKDYNKLLDYWSGKAAKPSEEEAWSILQELLKNINIRENVFHPDVVDAMFRQVSSNSAKPFKQNLITGNSALPAVDFDMGRQRYVYYDKDSARYQYTPGVNTTGNRGHTYRNDGVDIQPGKDGPYISSIEDDEWFQYTATVSEAGNYTVSFTYAAATSDGKLSLSADNKPVINELYLPATGEEQNWKTVSVKDISLKKGSHVFRVYAVKGGFSLLSIQFTKQK